MARHMAQGERARRGGNPRQAVGELWPGQSIPLLKALHLEHDDRGRYALIEALGQVVSPSDGDALAELRRWVDDNTPGYYSGETTISDVARAAIGRLGG